MNNIKKTIANTLAIKIILTLNKKYRTTIIIINSPQNEEHLINLVKLLHKSSCCQECVLLIFAYACKVLACDLFVV